MMKSLSATSATSNDTLRDHVQRGTCPQIDVRTLYATRSFLRLYLKEVERCLADGGEGGGKMVEMDEGLALLASGSCRTRTDDWRDVRGGQVRVMRWVE